MRNTFTERKIIVGSQRKSTWWVLFGWCETYCVSAGRGGFRTTCHSFFADSRMFIQSSEKTKSCRQACCQPPALSSAASKKLRISRAGRGRRPVRLGRVGPAARARVGKSRGPGHGSTRNLKISRAGSGRSGRPGLARPGPTRESWPYKASETLPCPKRKSGIMAVCMLKPVPARIIRRFVFAAHRHDELACAVVHCLL